MAKSSAFTGITPLQNGKEELIEVLRRLTWPSVGELDMSEAGSIQEDRAEDDRAKSRHEITTPKTPKPLRHNA